MTGQVGLAKVVRVREDKKGERERFVEQFDGSQNWFNSVLEEQTALG